MFPTTWKGGKHAEPAAEDLVRQVPLRAVPVSAAERLRAVAIAPLWVACTATWGATSAVMLTWSAVAGRRGPQR